MLKTIWKCTFDFETKFLTYSFLQLKYYILLDIFLKQTFTTEIHPGSTMISVPVGFEAVIISIFS